MSIAIFVHTAPCCPTMSSLLRCFGLPADLTHVICHCVLLIVHSYSFIWLMCPAHFHLVFVTYGTTYVTLVLSLMMMLQIQSFSLTLSIFLSMVRVTDHVWHPYVIVGKTHWLKTFLFRLMGRCLSRLIALFFAKTHHPVFILIETSCFVLISIAVFDPDIHSWSPSISVPSICMLSVVSIFVISLIFPLCFLRPFLKLSSMC